MEQNSDKRQVSAGILSFLKAEGISGRLLSSAEKLIAEQECSDLTEKIPVPRYPYYGKEVWEEALTAVISGRNLLLAGGKATGKNVLTQNLAALFMRPVWNISLHVNTDAATLIGADTFRNGEVCFQPGPVYACAAAGGFGVLDEINMAKNESLAVLHAVLDFRHAIEVPGYGSLPMRPETRFIATMNYGYAGTREVNEALASRFAIISMPTITEENLERLLAGEFPDMEPKYRTMFANLFFDLNKKAESSEISTRPLDLRGLLDSIGMMRLGLSPVSALDMGITNKSFDNYERTLIRDMIAARIPAKLTAEKLFPV